MITGRITELPNIFDDCYFATNIFEQEPYKSIIASNIFEPSIFAKMPILSELKERGL